MSKEQLQSREQTFKRGIPIFLVDDFGDDRSRVECEQVIRAIYNENNVIYEPPHTINDVESFNTHDGGFNIWQTLQNALRLHQPGIFVGVVDPGVGSDRRGIVVTTEEGYSFVGPDNGLFWPALKDQAIAQAYQIKPEAFLESSTTFHGRDQFSPIAAELSVGKGLETLKQLQKIDPNSLIQRSFLHGQVVEKDGYPNVKIWQDANRVPTNINGERPTHLTITTKNLIRRNPFWWSHSVTMPVVDHFEDVGVGKWGVLEGSSGGNTHGTNKGIAEVFIRDRAGRQGAGNRLRVETGDVVKLSWKYKGRR